MFIFIKNAQTVLHSELPLAGSEEYSERTDQLVSEVGEG